MDEGKKYLDPWIVERIEDLEEQGTIDLTALKPGIKIRVQTKNTAYLIDILDPNPEKLEILIQGHSELCPEPTPARFHGSTWGGSMLLMRKIGFQMHMEVSIIGVEGILTTTAVDSATIFGDGWEYDMWTN